MTLNVDFTPCHSCKLINLDLTSGFHQPLWTFMGKLKGVHRAGVLGCSLLARPSRACPRTPVHAAAICVAHDYCAHTGNGGSRLTSNLSAA